MTSGHPKLIVVKPLSHKMKNKVREFGPVWELVTRGSGEAHIATLRGAHNGGTEKYECIGKVGTDFDYEDVK